MAKKSLPVIYTPDFKRHRTSPQHPENPLRVEAIWRFLETGPLSPYLRIVEPKEAPFEWLTQVHDPHYVMRLEEACLKGHPHIYGPDNEISFDSFEVAKLAAGAVLVAVDLVEKEGETLVFCPVRPPGHHAEKDRALGFCLFNNVAVGARYWQKTYRRRLLILDWDAHHGNGIQHAFYENDSVFYVSLHENPRLSFPGTGLAEERGAGAGEGYTLNIPMPLESGDAEYLKAFQAQVDPAVRAFAPEGIMIAAGFDAHRDDDMSFLNLTTRGFAAMSAYVREWSRIFKAPVISVLEGGYELKSLVASVETHLKVLLGF